MHGSDITTRNSWDWYFCFHKTEWRVDSMDMDSEAFARMSAQAFAAWLRRV